MREETTRSVRLLVVSAALSFAAWPAAALAWLPAPYLWIVGGWAAFFIARAIRNRNRRRMHLYLGLASALVGFAGVEVLFLVRAHRKDAVVRQETGPTLGRPDQALGYVPNPGVRQHARSELDGEVIYDVHYTIGDDGLRVAVPPDAPPAERSILFFGCSFMFGQGLEDRETLAWQVGRRLRGRYRPYNFAFGGYGPHHMLASIEHGRVEQRVKEPPHSALYWAMTAHVARASRSAAWDPRGPRYVLDPDGSVRFAGHFDDPGAQPSPTLWDRAGLAVRAEIRKSYFLRKVVPAHPQTGGDVALWAEIVAESKRKLAQRYPGIEYHVILWDNRGVDWQSLQQGLEKRGVTTHRASRVLPGFDGAFHDWVLSPQDLHPNAKAHAALAAWVAEKIIGPEAR